MAIASINGADLYHLEVGDGFPCLLLHGGLGMDHTYLRTLDPLAGRLRLIYLDHRHNGRSSRPGLETVTMEQLADDAADLARHLGHEQVLVLGHSYGGFIAQELVLRHPDLVVGAVLANTTPGQLGTGESADDHQGPPMPTELLAMMAKFPGSDDEYAAMFSAMAPFYVHAIDGDALRAQFRDTIFRADAMIRGFQVLFGWSSVDRLGQVTAPVLVIGGGHDVFTSAPQSHRIAERIPKSEVVIFRDCGHFAELEDPDAFHATLESWIDRTI